MKSSVYLNYIVAFVSNSTQTCSCLHRKNKSIALPQHFSREKRKECSTWWLYGTSILSTTNWIPTKHGASSKGGNERQASMESSVCWIESLVPCITESLFENWVTWRHKGIGWKTCGKTIPLALCQQKHQPNHDKYLVRHDIPQAAVGKHRWANHHFKYVIILIYCRIGLLVPCTHCIRKRVERFEKRWSSCDDIRRKTMEDHGPWKTIPYDTCSESDTYTNISHGLGAIGARSLYRLPQIWHESVWTPRPSRQASGTNCKHTYMYPLGHF